MRLVRQTVYNRIFLRSANLILFEINGDMVMRTWKENETIKSQIYSNDIYV
jgi:hypothetical protein